METEMLDAPTEKPKRGRPSRKDTEIRTRRRRDDQSIGRHDPLALDGTKDPDYEYRWVNDDPGRMHRLTQEDDWDRVTVDDMGAENAKDMGNGAGIERVVDRGGKRAILVRKRKEWYEHDKAKAQENIDAMEQQIKHAAHGAEGLSPGEGYVPQGAISIGRRD